jgi:hypothetical protein
MESSQPITATESNVSVQHIHQLGGTALAVIGGMATILVAFGVVMGLNISEQHRIQHDLTEQSRQDILLRNHVDDLKNAANLDAALKLVEQTRVKP